MTIEVQNKCFTCIHAPVCVNNLGGADLDIVGTACKYYLSNHTLPAQKFWVLFDIPGFYQINAYETSEAHYRQGKLVVLEGVCRTNYTVVSDRDFGKTVFFTEEEAEAALEKLIAERQNERT